MFIKAVTNNNFKNVIPPIDRKNNPNIYFSGKEHENQMSLKNILTCGGLVTTCLGGIASLLGEKLSPGKNTPLILWIMADIMFVASLLMKDKHKERRD